MRLLSNGKRTITKGEDVNFKVVLFIIDLVTDKFWEKLLEVANKMYNKFILFFPEG
jgi:hypothetical protein